MRSPFASLATSLAATLLSLALASCIGPAPPPPGVAERPVPSPPRPVPLPAPAPLASDWRDWPLAPGDWTYRPDGRGSIALFGVPGGDAALTLRCDRTAGAIYLSRAGDDAGALTIRTSSLTRTLAAAPTGGAPAYVAVALSPGDGLLDAMGFSRGRFVIQQPGRPPLVVPAWAEVPRVTEDCRR